MQEISTQGSVLIRDNWFTGANSGSGLLQGIVLVCPALSGSFNLSIEGNTFASPAATTGFISPGAMYLLNSSASGIDLSVEVQNNLMKMSSNPIFTGTAAIFAQEAASAHSVFDILVQNNVATTPNGAFGYQFSNLSGNGAKMHLVFTNNTGERSGP